MSKPLFIRFEPEEDYQEIATASVYKDKVPLPEGQWNIRHADGTEEIMSVDQMPAHWQRQLNKWAKFGAGL